MEIDEYYKNLDKIIRFLKKIPIPGLLLVTGNGKDKNNIMTIGWMQIGVLWKEPSVSIAVRPSRYSYKMLQEFDEFTINVMPDSFKEAIAFCGAKSGSFCNKFIETNLTPISSLLVKAMSIKEAEYTLECKTIHRGKVSPDKLNDIILARYYSNGDYHDIITASIMRIK